MFKIETKKIKKIKNKCPSWVSQFLHKKEKKKKKRKKEEERNLLGHVCRSVSEVSNTVQHPNEVSMLSR